MLKRRSELVKHYKLNHRRYGRDHSYPCTYLHCTCRFKTWNAHLAIYQGITLPNKLSTKPYQHSHAIFVVIINSPLRGNIFNTSLIILKIRTLLHACSKTVNIKPTYMRTSKAINTGNILGQGISLSLVLIMLQNPLHVLPVIFQMGNV